MQINKSGDYARRKSIKGWKERESNIRKRIREEFEKGRKTYGPDRIIMELRQQGEKLGRHRCAAYMRDIGVLRIVVRLVVMGIRIYYEMRVFRLCPG